MELQKKLTLDRAWTCRFPMSALSIGEYGCGRRLRQDCAREGSFEVPFGIREASSVIEGVFTMNDSSRLKASSEFSGMGQSRRASPGESAHSLQGETQATSCQERVFSESCLTLKDVTKRFGEGEGAVTALDGVCLDVRKGEMLVILGMSGCGKSTLLNIMGGMSHPTSGSVVAGDRDLSRASAKELTAYRKDRVGFVFQSYNLIADLTASENVAIAASLNKRSMAVDQALDQVGVLDKKDKFPSQLSGGEQQRVSIARAIVKMPDFLLCDEPTGALDAETGKHVLGTIDELVRKRGRTAIIVTHCAPIADMADRVVKLRSGRIVEDYSNAQPLSSDEIEW